MTEKEKKILETFRRIIPQLDDRGKDSFLAYGEGIADAIERYGIKGNNPKKKPA